jgi:bacteriorhodopsin
MTPTPSVDQPARTRQPLLLIVVVFVIVAVVNAGMAISEPTEWQWVAVGACATMAVLLLRRLRATR